MILLQVVRTSRLGLPLPYLGLQGLCGGAGPPPSARTPVTFLAFDPFTSQMIPRYDQNGREHVGQQAEGASQ